MRVGKKYMVPVAILNDGQLRVIHDLKHNDPESGQHHYHYHVDTRFQQRVYHRVNEDDIKEIVYRVYECIDELENSSTYVGLLKNHKFKNKCIIDGKCPHKGYDLTKVEPIKTSRGTIIRCPMHSLEFEAETGKMLPLELIGEPIKVPRKNIKNTRPKVCPPHLDGVC